MEALLGGRGAALVRRGGVSVPCLCPSPHAIDDVRHAGLLRPASTVSIARRHCFSSRAVWVLPGMGRATRKHVLQGQAEDRLWDAL